MMRKKIVILYANEPDALTTQKINLLHSVERYDVCLLYWKRQASEMSTPFSCDLEIDHIMSVGGKVGKGYFGKMLLRCLIIVKLARRLRNIHPSIIHACSLDMLLAVLLAFPVKASRKIVFDLQDTDEQMLSILWRVMQKFLYQRVDLFFVTSPRFETKFLRYFQLIPSTTEVVCVPNSPPRSLFQGFRQKEEADTHVIGYIGTFRGQTSIRMLFEAACKLRQSGLDARILFAGTGVARPLVEKLAQENSFVSYLGPYNYVNDIKKLYEQVDFVYAIYDGSYDKRIHLACRFAEAVVCGLPIAVTEGTYMAELVGRYGIGFAVPLGDVEALVAGIRRFTDNLKERKHLSESCQHIRHLFSFDNYRNVILDAYAGL